MASDKKTAGDKAMGFWTLDRKIGMSFLVAVVSVGLYASISSRLFEQFGDAASMREHTYQVIDALDGSLSDLKDAESANRGFIITGDSIHLQKFEEARSSANQSLRLLQSIVSDNSEQLRRVASLDSLVFGRIRSLERTITIRADSGYEDARDEIASGRGRRLMEQVRGKAQEIKSVELNLLAIRSSQTSSAERSSRMWLIGGTAWLAALIVISGVWLTVSIKRPLKELLEGTRRITGGELDIALSVRSRDELGELAAAFNTMAVSLAAGAEAVANMERFFYISNDLFCIADFNGRFLKLNPAWEKVTGYPLKELEGVEFITLVHPDDIAGTGSEAAKLAEGGATVNFKNRYRRRDGVYVWLQWCSVSDVKRGFIYAVARDVTDEKEREARLRQTLADLEAARLRMAAANAELEAFSYSVSHDLRAPLRAIDGFSEVLLHDYSARLDDEGKDYLRRVRAATQRMGALIDDLLMLAHISRQELIFDDVNLSAMVGETLDHLRSEQPDRRVEAAIRPGVRVPGDSRLLRIVVENLVANAWKYTSRHEQARIEFGVRENGSGREYFVRDDGAGFDMQFAGRLFTAFQRLHNRSEFEGTGIGLATVARIIHRHGGEIRAEGAVEQGATFYFTLNPPSRERRTE